MSYRPQRWTTAAFCVATVVALVLTLVTDDPPGRLIFALATIMLAAYAIADLVFTPRLTADAHGLRIRTPTARADLRWDQIERLRADARVRHGLRSTALEIDAGDVLVLLGRRALGRDPELALDEVRAFDPRR